MLWNNHELTRNYPVRFLPQAAKWFRRFCVVEPPRIHSKLPCRPSPSRSKVVGGSSVWSNHPKLTRKLHCRPSFLCITVVRGGSVWSNHQTTQNSLQTAL